MHFLARHDVVGGRIDGDVFEVGFELARQSVDLSNAINFVPEKLDAHDGVSAFGGENFHYVAAHTEFVADEVDVVSLILDFDQLAQQFIPAFFHARTKGDDHGAVVDWIAEAVDTRNACHNNDVAAFGEGAGG